MTSKRVVLLNLAHQNRRPRCDRAAFRVLGIFGSADEARAHAAHVPTDASLHLLPLNTWTPIMRDEEAPDALAHLEVLGQRNRDRIQQHAEEFEANVSNRRTGSVQERPAGARGSVATRSDGEPVANVPISSEVRMQRFAVVSVLQDEAEDNPDRQQPAVLIWEATETEQEARDVIKDRISRTVSDVHLDVVAMYEWLFPTSLDLSLVKEEYRDEKLDELMRHRKDEHMRVAEFRALCEQRGQEVPVIDVSQPGGEDAQLELPPSEPPSLASLGA
jgi:hypothetical protein